MKKRFILPVLLLFLFITFSSKLPAQIIYNGNNCWFCRPDDQNCINACEARYTRELKIISRSKCDPPIEDTLTGMSTASNTDSIYYLSRHGMWKQYAMFNGSYIERTSSSLRYKDFRKNKLKVLIYKTPDLVTCKIKIEGISEEPLVYRHN